MARAERQGWNTWSRFKKAGVVEDSVLFNDDDIIKDNTLGRTKKTLGICWPIDAAVAYTLASHGPDAQLTIDDMVNQNTRIASVMMSGKVEWGTLPNPHAESCGHDEINAYLVRFGIPKLSGSGAIWFTSSDIREWAHWDEMSDSMKARMVFRVDKADYNNKITPKVAWILTDHYKDIREFIMQKMGTHKFSISNLDENLNTSTTLGECAWADDPEKSGTCSHHNTTNYEGWVMIKERDDSDACKTLWRRGKGCVVASRTHVDPLYRRLGWNYTNQIPPTRVIIFDRVKRSLSQSIPDEFVKEQIKGSIARMRKWDGRCLVDKTGRGKTAKHKWSEWEWLYEIVAWVQDTKSKNRHENETQCRICYSNGEVDEYGKSLCRCGQGWKYIKYDVKQSYGHEIAKFEWRPITRDYAKIYALKVGNTYLPWRFKTQQEAAQMREFFAMTGTQIPNLSFEKRTWDLATGQEVLAIKGQDTGIKIASIQFIMTMKWNRDPENLPTPTEALHMIQWGNPLENSQALENIKSIHFVRRNHHGYTRDFNLTDMKLINANENLPVPSEENEETSSGGDTSEEVDDGVGFGGLGELFG
tara:strand:- start:161 stop:1921 length:1761 start_codon:yes stop_codon:yes gene_type:complete